LILSLYLLRFVTILHKTNGWKMTMGTGLNKFIGFLLLLGSVGAVAWQALFYLLRD